MPSLNTHLCIRAAVFHRIPPADMVLWELERDPKLVLDWACDNGVALDDNYCAALLQSLSGGETNQEEEVRVRAVMAASRARPHDSAQSHARYLELRAACNASTDKFLEFMDEAVFSINCGMWEHVKWLCAKLGQPPQPLFLSFALQAGEMDAAAWLLESGVRWTDRDLEMKELSEEGRALLEAWPERKLTSVRR